MVGGPLSCEVWVAVDDCFRDSVVVVPDTWPNLLIFKYLMHRADHVAP